MLCPPTWMPVWVDLRFLARYCSSSDSRWWCLSSCTGCARELALWVTRVPSPHWMLAACFSLGPFVLKQSCHVSTSGSFHISSVSLENIDTPVSSNTEHFILFVLEYFFCFFLSFSWNLYEAGTGTFGPKLQDFTVSFVCLPSSPTGMFSGSYCPVSMVLCISLGPTDWIFYVYPKSIDFLSAGESQIDMQWKNQNVILNGNQNLKKKMLWNTLEKKSTGYMS